MNGNILSVPPKSDIIYKPAEDAFCATVWIHNNTEQYQSQLQALRNSPTSFLPTFWLIYPVHIYLQFDYQESAPNVFLNQEQGMLLLSLHPKKHQQLSHGKQLD